MAEAHACPKEPFEDRRSWRLLLARLHPDAGGDHELFLFACALKDEVCSKRLVGDGPEASQSFSTWRRTMGSWRAQPERAQEIPPASRWADAAPLLAPELLSALLLTLLLHRLYELPDQVPGLPLHLDGLGLVRSSPGSSAPSLCRPGHAP